MDMDPSGPFHKTPRASFFILFSYPFHPFWFIIIEKEDQIGWRLKIYGLTVQGLRVDGSNDWVNGD